jgi:hypothetical protein
MEAARVDPNATAKYILCSGFTGGMRLRWMAVIAAAIRGSRNILNVSFTAMLPLMMGVKAFETG